jgi:hypothetical protein
MSVCMCVQWCVRVHVYACHHATVQVAVKIAPQSPEESVRMFGRHFDEKDLLMSKVWGGGGGGCFVFVFL